MAVRLINGAEFIHIPKTGGTWVEEALRRCNLIASKFGHKHADYERALHAEKFGGSGPLLIHLIKDFAARIGRGLLLQKHSREQHVFRFCFVRHPLKWYESWWKYMRPKGWHDWGRENSRTAWHPNSTLNGCGAADFNTFVRNVIKKRPGYVSELYFSYTKPGIGFIGKTENLVNDLIFILKAQGLQFDEAVIHGLERVNVSKSNEAAIEWDPALRRTVMLLELPALTHFGYLSAAELGQFNLTEVIPANPAMQRLRVYKPDQQAA